MHCHGVSASRFHTQGNKLPSNLNTSFWKHVISMHKLKYWSWLFFFMYSLNELILTTLNPSVYPNKSISLWWAISPSGKRLWNYSLLEGLPFPSSPLTKTFAYNFTFHEWWSLTIVYPSEMMKCKNYATTSILPILDNDFLTLLFLRKWLIWIQL